MGYRTVVMLNNDFTHKWANDPELGQKIQTAMNFANRREEDPYENRSDFGYGKVVECVHADTRTLAVLDFYTGFEPIAHGNWWAQTGKGDEEVKLELLRQVAEDLGYHIRKKPVRKPYVRRVK